jgi:hypothetical protein
MDHARQDVEHHPYAGHHHEHRKEASVRGEGVYLFVAHGREGDDDHVGGVEERPTLDEHVARYAQHHQGGKREQASGKLRFE